MKVNSYKDFDVWKRGVTLSLSIYRITSSFPKSEKFGLVSQMRRAAVSVPSNIAEGQARQQSGDFARFLSIARGSLAELDTQTVIARELELLDESAAQRLAEQVDILQRMLYNLSARIEERRGH